MAGDPDNAEDWRTALMRDMRYSTAYGQTPCIGIRLYRWVMTELVSYIVESDQRQVVWMANPRSLPVRVLLAPGVNWIQQGSGRGFEFFLINAAASMGPSWSFKRPSLISWR